MAVSLTNEQLKTLMQDAVTAALGALQPSSEAERPTQGKIKHAERPQIDVGCNEDQWEFFQHEWKSYKRRTSIKNTQLSDELSACCTKDLRKILFDFVGSAALDKITEDQLLKNIKSAAVIGKNTSVHRKEFYSIMQSQGEPVNLFVAKLRSKAEHCNFKVTCVGSECNEINSYAEAMVSDQMVAGLYDKDIQQDVLAKGKELRSFQDRYNLIEAQELGRLAKTQLDGNASSANVVKSQYKKQQSAAVEGNARKSEGKRCKGCNSEKHDSLERSTKCPAWGKTCYRCGKFNHFGRCCLQKTRTDNGSTANVIQSLESESASYFLSFSSDLNRRISEDQEYLLPHVEWDGEKFMRKAPEPLPALSVIVRPMMDCHESAQKSNSIRVVREHVTVQALTDTCAQTCISDEGLLEKLNFSKDYLRKTSHRIIGVTGDQVHVKGSLLAEIEYNGRIWPTVIYIASGINGLFISKKVQVELGLLPVAYPDNSRSLSHMSPNSKLKAPCGCLKRTKPPDKPEVIPFSPVAENRKKLEDWLIERYLSSAFNKCEHQLLPKMTGKPLDIHFKDDREPRAVHTPISVPHHWKGQVKKDLDRDVALGVIEPVPQGTPTTWCSRMVVVAKSDKKPRRTIDFQHLNNACLRETHHTIPPFHQVSMIPPNTKKTTLDAWNGYHSLPLSEESKNATTFITEWGRYRYLGAPQGLHSSGDGYTRRYDDIIADTPRKTKIVDDSCLWDKDIEEAFWHTVEYLTHCCENGITFNAEKFHFAEDEVDFGGFRVTNNGIKPLPRMVNAIGNFPTPKNITDLRSFFGLVNQVNYTFANSNKLQPFRDLLEKNTKWYWDDSLDHIFNDTKDYIVAQIHRGVRNFEVDRPTCLWTDWCKEGLGFSLLQKYCNCKLHPTCCKEGWKLVFVGSRFTSESERNYAPIEGETLAVSDALNKCRMFVLGCPNLCCTHELSVRCPRK